MVSKIIKKEDQHCLKKYAKHAYLRENELSIGLNSVYWLMCAM
jgi:hypothetical protein